jgi:hypothetical protein
MASDSGDSGGGPIALVVAFIGALGFAAALTCAYEGMRDLMINSGGACASGGPYQINPDQVCTPGQTGLLIGGILGGLVFAGILTGASGWYNDNLGGYCVGLLLWAATFGALGFNFLQIGHNPPANLAGGGGFIVTGIIFEVMALGGLIPGLMILGGAFKDSAHPEDVEPLFDAPIVRANVNFERKMPGDPMFGKSDPNEMKTPTAPATEQAPERKVESTNDFVDPVTGERTGGNDG